MLTEELKDYLAGIKQTGLYSDDVSLRTHLDSTGWNSDEIENALVFLKTLPDTPHIEQRYNGKTKEDILISLPTGEVEFGAVHHDSDSVRLTKIIGSVVFVPLSILIVYVFVMPLVDSKEVHQELIISNWNDAVAGGFSSKSRKVQGLATVYYYDDKRVLELSDFETAYGMNLRVLMAQTEEGAGAADLGPLPGTKGQMYLDIPDSISHTKYKYVIIRDKTFNTNYGVAELE